MKKGVLYGAALLMLASCGKSNRFVISGEVAGSKMDTIYLEHVGMNEITVLDSAVLLSDGEFTFKKERPEFSPEFYRLRLKDQFINLSVDSTEEITIKTDVKKFASAYTVEGSQNCLDIQKLNNSAINTKVRLDALIRQKNQKQISTAQFDSTLSTVLGAYKEEASKFIFANPKSAAAYFALFQKIYSYLIFNPYKKEDLRVFAAVATSYDVYHPNSPRSKHLKEFTLQAMKATRAPQELKVSEEQVNVKGSFEIELPDISGSNQKLSAQLGKVVILCFTAYQTKFSPELNMELGEIYGANRAKGFEIFQVSLDTDENFWKVSASNLPWKCVRDAEGQYSEFARTYNVSQLPTLFIVNRQGEVVKRIENLKTLRSEIEKML